MLQDSLTKWTDRESQQYNKIFVEIQMEIVDLVRTITEMRSSLDSLVRRRKR